MTGRGALDMKIEFFDPPRGGGRLRRSAVCVVVLTALSTVISMPSPGRSAEYLNRAQMKQLMTGAVLAYKNRWGDVELIHQADGTFAGKMPARKSRDRQIKGNWWIDRTARLCRQVIGFAMSSKVNCAHYRKTDGQKYMRIDRPGRETGVRIYRK
jgi:hypothetical protein